MPNGWIVAAPNLAGYGEIYCLYDFSNGLFGGDDNDSSLLKLTGNIWTPVGNGLISWGLKCQSLVECNGFLYGLSGPSPTYLIEWDPVGLDWQIFPVASVGMPAPVTIYPCASMVKLGNQIYMVRQNGANGGVGMLFLWDGIRIPRFTQFYGFSAVSPGYIGDTAGGLLLNLDNTVSTPISIVFNGVIYVGTKSFSAVNNGGGYLLQWDGVPGDKMTIAAPKIDGQKVITSMIVYNSQLYAGTSPNGELLQWNGTNAWTRVAPQLGTETSVDSLVVHNGNLYAGTGPNGLLYKWDGIGNWVQVLPQYLTQTDIAALISFNGNLYGASFGPGSSILLELINPSLSSNAIKKKLFTTGMI